MATHEALFENAILAIRGSKSARHLGIEGGSVNYRLLDDGVAWILDPNPTNTLTLLGHFKNMEQTGHMSLRGPKGVACEQGSPLAHRKFNMAMVLGIYRWARERVSEALTAACERVILGEVGLTLAFQYRGVSVIPAPRVKDQKGQGPVDDNRDRLAAVLCGVDPRKIKTGKNFWKDDEGNLDVILSRELVEKGIWDADWIAIARDADVPRLYLPINFTGTGDGFEAWIDDTPDARRVMGRDGCHFVHAAEDGIWWRVDWEPEFDEEGKSNNQFPKPKRR